MKDQHTFDRRSRTAQLETELAIYRHAGCWRGGESAPTVLWPMATLRAARPQEAQHCDRLVEDVASSS